MKNNTSKFLSLKPSRDKFDELFGDFFASIEREKRICVSKFSECDYYFRERCKIEKVTQIQSISVAGSWYLFTKFENINRCYVMDCIHQLEMGCKNWRLNIYHSDSKQETVPEYFIKRCELEGIKMSIDNDAFKIRVTCEIETHTSCKGKESVTNVDHNKFNDDQQLLGYSDSNLNLLEKKQSISSFAPVETLISKLRLNYKHSCKDRDIKLEEAFQMVIVEKIIDASIHCKTFVTIQSEELYLYNENFEWYKDRCIIENIHIVRCGGYDNKHYVQFSYQCDESCVCSCGEKVKVYFEPK